MPTTRKQKKARKSRGTDILSDIEKLEIMLGGNHLERDEESEFSISGRRPDSPYNTLINQDTDSCSNSREGEIRGFSQNAPNLRKTDYSN